MEVRRSISRPGTRKVIEVVVPRGSLLFVQAKCRTRSFYHRRVHSDAFVTSGSCRSRLVATITRSAGSRWNSFGRDAIASAIDGVT